MWHLTVTESVTSCYSGGWEWECGGESGTFKKQTAKRQSPIYNTYNLNNKINQMLVHVPVVQYSLSDNQTWTMDRGWIAEEHSRIGFKHLSTQNEVSFCCQLEKKIGS